MLADDDMAEIENRLVAARTRLILDKPFLGALALRLPLKAAAGWCAATHSDARSFYYNPEYIKNLRLDQVQFVLSAEALHCGLSHFNRIGHRQAALWQQACAYSVNLILRDEGLTPPADALLNDDYRGLTAEEIYPLLDEKDESEDRPEQDGEDRPEQDSDEPEDDQPRQHEARPGDDSRLHAGSGGSPRQDNREMQPDEKDSPRQDTAGPDSTDSGAATSAGRARKARDGSLAAAPPPLNEADKDLLQQQWQQRLAGAAQQALQAGKMGQGMARLIELMLQPSLPWRAVLARFMNAIARDDYSYARPSSRRGDPAIFPSLRSGQIDLVVAVDVSGSIDAAELNEFMSEIDVLKAQVRARVTLLTCDSKITGDSPWIFEAWERCQLPAAVSGGGGTDFRPVFDWVETGDRPPDLLIYFTDAQGRFPGVEPDYPSLWLVKGTGDVPWGQRIQLN